MSESPDVVVVGGGIVGLFAALAAADAGRQVDLMDDDRRGAASRASAGMLGPSVPGLPASLREFAFAARDLYPETVARLREGSGIDIPLERNGILEVATSDAELDALHRRGSEAERLDQRSLGELEPALGAHPGALHHLLDGCVDNLALMDALWICAERNRRIRVTRDRVSSITVAAGTSASVMTEGGRLECQRIVVAGGAWCGALPGIPRRIPVVPVKGELLTMDRRAVRHVIYGTAGYIVPRRHELLVGATSEVGQFDHRPTSAGRSALLATAATLVPDLDRARVAAHWGGIRPISPDGLPILGEDPEHPALVYACGFSRNGILLAPWAGSALAALLADQVHPRIPVEFRPGRFWN